MKKLHTLFVSTTYPRTSNDWRGTFIANISNAMANNPQLHVRLWAPPGEVHPDIETVTEPQERNWLYRLMEYGGISHWLRNKPVAGLFAALSLLSMLRSLYRRSSATTDIYHINWLQCALPLPADKKPALITVLGNDMALLKLPLMKPLLRHAMKNRKVAICPNASWMEPYLQEHFGQHALIHCIPFGIDPCWYAIKRNIPAQPIKPRWLVVLRLTKNKLGPLLEWSAPLFANGHRELHLFGPMQEQIDLPNWVHYHGPVSPSQLAEEWFPTAHGLITLSEHAEGRPQVMLEAMAAGLPIIASDLAAHADFIDHEKTGLLCKSPADYRQALEGLENLDKNKIIGNAAKTWVTNNIGTWDDCVSRYTRIYSQLLSHD